MGGEGGIKGLQGLHMDFGTLTPNTMTPGASQYLKGSLNAEATLDSLHLPPRKRAQRSSSLVRFLSWRSLHNCKDWGSRFLVNCSECS